MANPLSELPQDFDTNFLSEHESFVKKEEQGANISSFSTNNPWLVENFDETYQGYYWQGWKWHEANAMQVGEFVGNQELSNEEFIKKFGRIKLWLLRGQTAHISQSS